MGRGRRSYSSRSGSGWFSNFTAGPTWPFVQKVALKPYQPVLVAQNLGYGCKLDDIQTILRSAHGSSIQRIRAKASADQIPDPTLSGEFPNEPTPPSAAPPLPPEPNWADYEPKVRYKGWFEGVKDVLSGTANQRERDARTKFEADSAKWKNERPALERAVESYRNASAQYERDIVAHRQQKQALETAFKDEKARVNEHRRKVQAEINADISEIDSVVKKASSRSSGGIEKLAVMLFNAIPFPGSEPREIEAHFDDVGGILLLTISLPRAGFLGLHVPLKTKNRSVTDKELATAQEYITHALPLRLMHEVFQTGELFAVELVGINMRLRYTEKHTGNAKNEIIGSIAATREEFSKILVSQADPKLCFRALKGVATPSFQEVSPVRPVLSFDKSDRRIIASRDVVDGLHQDTNLAAMDWEDFEHVVRELFSKMFSKRSVDAEVHVTRASRDYGVDALIHDPDPIHGGKFVIQAKRYVNTVEVSAIRDLFGTVQNEGANRGYLVTTSSFGPDAHAFAKGKPLTLVDGPHLLSLLKEHGYFFRINLAEARQVLHGR